MPDSQANASSGSLAPVATDTVPTLAPEREAELRAIYDANRAKGRPPYADAMIASTEELRWILRERDWSTEISTSRERDDPQYLRQLLEQQLLESGGQVVGALDAPEGKARADLRGIYLRNVDLRGVSLLGADLSGAHLDLADLTGADLRGVRLTGAVLQFACLRETILRWAKLRGTDLRNTDLSGADLRGAQFDGTTQLNGATLDAGVKLANVAWNGVPLASVNWQNQHLLGDEALARREPRGPKRRRLVNNALGAYRGLGAALRAEGLFDDAAQYRLREQRLERKALLSHGKVGEGFLSWLSDVIANYGEAPARPFFIYFLVVCAFASAYYFISGQEPGKAFTPLASFVFSVTSFHGRGFFPGEPLTLENPITVVAAFEAVIGLLVELVLIGTFSRRFLENR